MKKRVSKTPLHEAYVPNEGFDMVSMIWQLQRVLRIEGLPPPEPRGECPSLLSMKPMCGTDEGFDLVSVGLMKREAGPCAQGSHPLSPEVSAKDCSAWTLYA